MGLTHISQNTGLIQRTTFEKKVSIRQSVSVTKMFEMTEISITTYLQTELIQGATLKLMLIQNMIMEGKIRTGHRIDLHLNYQANHSFTRSLTCKINRNYLQKKTLITDLRLQELQTKILLNKNYLISMQWWIERITLWALVGNMDTEELVDLNFSEGVIPHRRKLVWLLRSIIEIRIRIEGRHFEEVGWKISITQLLII